MTHLTWNKKGRIFNPIEFSQWNRTHGQVPFYININGEEKIFFTSRPKVLKDGGYTSSVHSINFDGQKLKVIGEPSESLLDLGDLGTFDDSGTMPCSVIINPINNEVWMYYVGWSRKLNVPYDNAIGLAISKDQGKTFEKYSQGPILGANVLEPFILGCPRVHIFNNKWYMFYLGGIKWVDFNGRKESIYKLKVATSEDGINWKRNTNLIIEEKYENECQTCATVFEKDNKYHMLFTFRHSIDFRNPERGYRIGYASSQNLLDWERNDSEGNFKPSETGWDSEMVCYPNIFVKNKNFFLLYCGNKFGLAGFGLAQLNQV